MTLTATSHDQYRHRARRLRCRYRHDPAMKLYSLRMLSRTHDRAQELADVCTGVSDSAHEFTRRITCELTASRTLRYSRRLALLRRAQRAGISRFDANLMIAAVQHRSPESVSIGPPPRRPPLLSVVAFVLVQSVILLGGWIIFAG